jgi:hypothetical protein
MAHPSPTDLLALHAVRLKGFADTDAVAARFDLDKHQTHEDLLDAQALGRVTRSSFADLTAWSLTEAGRRHNEAQLRDELDRAGARDAVDAAHEAFLPLNGRATQVLTAWQLDRRAGAFGELADLAEALRPLERDLAQRLTRFAGYHRRFVTALDRAHDDPQWITGIDVDSCHRVWFELHEDLIATLGVTR